MKSDAPDVLTQTAQNGEAALRDDLGAADVPLSGFSEIQRHGRPNQASSFDCAVE